MPLVPFNAHTVQRLACFVHQRRAPKFRQGKGSAMLRRLASAALACAVTFVGLAAAPQAQAATCVYYVKVFAYVRENPSPNSKILKSKGTFERVTGPCRAQNGFTAVYTAAASDGIGWINSSKLM
jgi:hypothetical protein